MVGFDCLLILATSSSTWAISTVLGLVALVYVGGPLMIWWSQKLEATPQMVPFNPDEYDWPADIDELFSTAIDELGSSGFEVTGGVLLPRAVPNVQTALVLLANRAEKDVVMVTATIATNNFASLRNLYLEFSTNFQDGFEYNTNNTDQLLAFPPEPHKRTYQFVQVKEPRKLYDVHQAILNANGRHCQQKVLKVDRQFGGDAIADLLDGIREELELATKRGYLRRTSDGQYYRPTVIGAILMTWKELWPWKAIRRMKRDRSAQAILSNLGVE